MVRGGSQVDQGPIVLSSAIVWGSTLDAVAADRHATASTLTAATKCSITSGITDIDGGMTASRMTPTAGSATTGSLVRATMGTPSGGAMTAGVNTHIVLDVQADSGFIGQDPNNSVTGYLISPGGAGNHVQALKYSATPEFRYLSPDPMRQIQYARSDRWHRSILRADFPVSGWSPDIRMPFDGTATFTGANGLVVGPRHYWQVPLTSWPARAGSGTFTPAAEASAPDLDLATIYPDQQLAGWGDGSRCLGFDGQSETVTIGGIASALSGTDPSWSITFLWRPVVRPAANAQVLLLSGSTASLKLEHLTTGELKLTRIADDATSASVTTSRVVGLVEHALSIVCSAGTITIYSQGQQWGDALDLTSGKAATFTTAILGGGTWIGKVAEFVVHGRALSAGEVSPVHRVLCAARGVPVGARETWIINGQSNACANGSGWTTDTLTPLSGCSGSHYAAELDAAGPFPNIVTYGGWGPARAFAQDKRKDNATATGSYNGSFHNFGSEAWAHKQVPGLTTIRVARAGASVYEWNGALRTALARELDDAIDDAGVPLRIVGVLYVNGENEAGGLAGSYYDELTELDDWLKNNYASDVTAWYSIVRKLPYNLNDHAAPNVAGDQVRTDTDTFVADAPTRRASFLMDDDYLGIVTKAEWWADYPTMVHGGAPHRKAEGERFAIARASLGFPATAR